jgi:hypothetical protein
MDTNKVPIYPYVKPKNKEKLKRMAKKAKMSESAYVDYLLDKMKE